jgi:hypothetical protein
LTTDLTGIDSHTGGDYHETFRAWRRAARGQHRGLIVVFESRADPPH